MKRPVPDIIKQVGLPFSWEGSDIWGIDAPTESMHIRELTWHFDYPFWPTQPDGFYDLTANQVMTDPAKYDYEQKRIDAADTSYPIDIYYHNTRWVILDGLHRLVKLAEAGEKKIRVRKITYEQMKGIIKK